MSELQGGKRRNRGQVVPMGERRFVLRVFLGRLHGQRKYYTETYYGDEAEARRRLQELLEIQAVARRRGLILMKPAGYDLPF